jgi:ABC-type transport system involved in cytochrome c biogenesis permease subunit
MPLLAQAQTAQLSITDLRDKELIQTWATLPVQEEGRVKPLETVARYRLLRFHGTQSIRFVNPETSTREKFSAMEWLLINWFRPDIAKTMPVFRVDFVQAVNELGVDTTKKEKFDKYSYDELVPHRQVLMEKMNEYGQMEAKKRKPEQRMLVDLGRNFLDYEMILNHWDFARQPFGGDAQETLPADLAARLSQPLRASTALKPVGEYLAANPSAGAPMSNPWLMSFMRGALSAMMSGNQEQSLRLFPSANSDAEQWSNPGILLLEGVQGTQPTAEQVAWLQRYEDVYASSKELSSFKLKSAEFAQSIVDADKLQISRYVKLEQHFLKADYFYYAVQFFIGGLLLLGLSFFSKAGNRWSKWCVRLCTALLAVGTVLTVIGIILRCIIMQRPPITTLYETILFIGATAALAGFMIEWVTRKKWGLLLAGICGAASFFMAMLFEQGEGQDTFQQLQAVLITNFWLSTHVPCVNLGYMACMVAAIMSMIYTAARCCGILEKESQRDITRITYGLLCAGLLFALIGTILGGIWANYSWGRFWGWDPKENGALMICIMCLIMLHARLGGLIREIGMHACSLILGCITLFSWFGVNQLGVGLHAYGFTDGVWGKLSMYWGSQLILLLALGLVKLSERKHHSFPPSET